MEDAGVVVEDVQAPERLEGKPHHRLDISRFGDISPDECRLASGRLDFLRGFLAGARGHVGNHHFGPLGGEQVRRGAAHSAGGSRDQRDLILQAHATSLPPAP